MTNAELRYTGKGWNSLGPVLLTDTIRTLCHVGRGTNHSISGYHQNCYGLTVLNHSSFYPIKHIDRKILFQTNADKFWMVLFSNSYSVHFYGSNTSGRYLIWNYKLVNLSFPTKLFLPNLEFDSIFCPRLFCFFYSVHCFLYKNFLCLKFKVQFVKTFRGWITGKGTAYDIMGRNYCPVFYSVQNNMNLWPMEYRL